MFCYAFLKKILHSCFSIQNFYFTEPSTKSPASATQPTSGDAISANFGIINGITGLAAKKQEALSTLSQGFSISTKKHTATTGT